MIAIIDYQMGNLGSVAKAILKAGGNAIVTSDKSKIYRAKKIVLPGVGASGDGIKELKKLGLIKIIKDSISAGKPFFGICLGMQLLFEKSQESGGVELLGLLKGKVKKFPSNLYLKVPHMGWNQVSKATSHQPPVTGELLKDIPDNSYVYFVHSYYCDPADKSIITGVTDYGINFASVIRKNNIFGCQFHPEKSQDTGLKILENFINRC